MPIVNDVRDVNVILFNRYLNILDAHKTTYDVGHLIWMCQTGIEKIQEWPVDKSSRWIGFIQGSMVHLDLIKVKEERDFSRPLFHRAYVKIGEDIPETVERETMIKKPAKNRSKKEFSKKSWGFGYWKKKHNLDQ